MALRNGLRVPVGMLAVLLGATIGEANAQVAMVTEPRPLVTIGAEDRGEAYLFGGIAGVLQLSNGEIFVAHCGTNELRWFDAKGIHLRSAGRTGAGPGEFRYLRRVFSAGGDTIAAFEAIPAGRVTLFTPDGKVGRSFAVPIRLDVLGRMRDGSFVGRLPATIPRGPEAPGIQRRTTAIHRLDATGVPVDSVTGLPGFEALVEVNRPPRAPRMGRLPVMAVLADGIAYGGQESAEYTEFGMDLKVRRRVTTLSKPEPMTAALRDRWEAARPVMIPSGGVVGAFGGDYADAAPAYKDIIAGTDGRVWVQDPARPAVFPLVWTAYRDGRPDARAELPPRFFPTQFGSDWVLGVSYDESNVEQVRLLRLTRGAHSGKVVTPREGEPPAQPRCGTWTSR